MGSVLVSASMRRVYEPEAAAPAPSAPEAPAVPHSRMQEPPDPMAVRRLPFDLLLLMGYDALTLFPRGPFDELSFFQRVVPGEHELEYVTCLDQASDGETVRGYGLFSLTGESEPLLKLSRQTDLWDRLQAQHLLHRVPDARTILIRAPNSYDPAVGAWTGRNRVVPPYGDLYDRFRVEGQRPISYPRVLQVLRQVCRPRQLIAWIESGIPNAPSGTVLHRYYLDARRNVYLVRQVGRKRRLYLPRRCAASEVPTPRRSLRVPEWPPVRRDEPR